MINSKDTHPQKHLKHFSHPKLKQERVTTNMDPNNRGGIQKESPTTTTIKAPTTSPKQHQPPLLLNPHHHHTSTPPPRITTTITTHATPRLSRHKSKKTRLKVSKESSKHCPSIQKKQPRRINPQTIQRDKDYVVKPPRQETGSDPKPDQKEDETQQQNTGSDGV